MEWHTFFGCTFLDFREEMNALGFTIFPVCGTSETSHKISSIVVFVLTSNFGAIVPYEHKQFVISILLQLCVHWYSLSHEELSLSYLVWRLIGKNNCQLKNVNPPLFNKIQDKWILTEISINHNFRTTNLMYLIFQSYVTLLPPN